MRVVLRFENSDGLGPYTSQALHLLDPRDCAAVFSNLEPIEDGCKLKGSISQYGGFCGFKDMKQLMLWFDGKVRLVRGLMELGQRLIAYEVPEEAYFECDSQVVFIKSKAIQVDVMLSFTPELKEMLLNAYEEAITEKMEKENERRNKPKEPEQAVCFGYVRPSRRERRRNLGDRQWTGSSRFYV